MGAGRRNPGDVVLYRDVQRRGVWWAIPHIVVFDDGDAVGLYAAPGTPMLGPSAPDSASDRWWMARLADGDHGLSEMTWEHNHVLRLLSPHVEHNVELYWSDPAWEFLAWYVNLQTPFERSQQGFDKRDQALDIVVTPDRHWSWKDEEHVEALLELGYFDLGEVERMRAEGQRVITRVEEWGAPFCDGWEKWRPEANAVSRLRRVRLSDLNAF
jgi:hypothetical protein